MRFEPAGNQLGFPGTPTQRQDYADNRHHAAGRRKHESRDGQQKTAESDRHPCRQPGSPPSDDARNEPGKARRTSRHHFPADPEIREGHQPDRREPPPAHRHGPPGPGRLLLRRRSRHAERGSRHGRGAAGQLCRRTSCRARKASSSTRPSSASRTPSFAGASSISSAPWRATTKRRLSSRRRACAGRCRHRQPGKLHLFRAFRAECFCLNGPERRMPGC